MSQIWYTADTHFCHKNILQHENRPYDSVEEMNETLIDIWNRTVNKNDTVYHLGDFVFGGISKWERILPRLKGKIHLVLGNHDDEKAIKKLSHYFESVENMIVKNINKQHLYLFHYPIEIGLTPNTYSIHGHIHSIPSNCVNQINVGVDSLFTTKKVGFGNLVSEETILEELSFRKELVMQLREERLLKRVVNE
jgi:calcineurin-like phosphoesterase family protein